MALLFAEVVLRFLFIFWTPLNLKNKILKAFCHLFVLNKYKGLGHQKKIKKKKKKKNQAVYFYFSIFSFC